MKTQRHRPLTCVPPAIKTSLLRSFKSEWCTNWLSHFTLLCVVYMFVGGFHLLTQKLEQHSKQVAACESIAEDSFKWSHLRISFTEANVRVANYRIILSLEVKWLRFWAFFFCNYITEPAAPEENLMFNGEVEHPESPTGEVEKGDEGTTPPKAGTKLQDSKPVIETPSDPQVCGMIWVLIFYTYSSTFIKRLVIKVSK